MSLNNKGFSLFFQLVMSILLISAIIIGFFSYFVYINSRTVFIRNYTQELSKAYISLSHGPRFNRSDFVGQGMGRMGPAVTEQLFIKIDDEIIQNPDNLEDYSFFSGSKIINVDDDMYLLYGFTDNNNKVILGSRIAEYDLFLQGFRSSILLASIIAILISLFASIILSKRISEPLKKVSNSLRKIVVSDLSSRVSIKTKTKEIKKLIEVINKALTRIENGYKKQEQFASDVAHEIMTPLTSILGFSRMITRWASSNQQMTDEAAKNIEETSKNLIELAEKLLLLSQPDSKAELTSENLKEVILNQTAEVQSYFDFEVELEIPEELIVKTNRELLGMSLKILFENAVKHAKTDIVKIKWINANKELHIIDNGEGIPESEKERLFERFYKVDKSRSTEGFGLGLSIFKKIIDKIDLEVYIENAEETGTDFVIRGWNISE
ncbi:MAG: sensor histidine kinase [Kosmotogaceae bacterium]